MELNKYLRDIGIDETCFPFKDEEENKQLKKQGKPYDKRYLPDKEGFVEAERWDLNSMLDMIIYTRLCDYRKHGADVITPGEFALKKHGHKKWLKALDKIIYGFELRIVKVYIEKDGLTEKEYKQIEKSRKLFAKYYDSFWIWIIISSRYKNK